MALNWFDRLLSIKSGLVVMNVYPSLEEYQQVKFRYNKLLNSNHGQRKGDLRAFIGTRTWLLERELLKKEKRELDNHSSHIKALPIAISDLRRSINNNTFNKDFSELKNKWINSGKELRRDTPCEALAPPPLRRIGRWAKNRYTHVSLFSGALGLDLGFLAAGFDLRMTNDIKEESKDTITQNLDGITFVHRDSSNLTSDRILDIVGLKPGELDLLTGGPPCQPFSTAGKREGLNDPRSSPLKDFVRLIKGLNPRVFVMEEVTGLQSARLKHVPISEREKRELRPEERKGSAFQEVLRLLNTTGYKYKYGVLNAADYGAPQVRNRLIFIGVRKGTPSLPEPTYINTHVNLGQRELFQKLKPWNTFWDATLDLQGRDQDWLPISEKRKKYMQFVPPGGHWRHIPEPDLQEAMGGAYKSGGGKMGYYRRLSWDEPSPTVVTSPSQKGTMLCHPESMRYLSIQEYKRIQGFPDDWKMVGSKRKQYALIGDAVPVHLSYSIAKHVKRILRGKSA